MDLSEVGTEVVRRHPWEVSRSRFFLGLLEERRLTRSSQPILDIGAGDAWFARELSGVLPSTTDITCWDVNYAESGSSVIEEAGDLILTAERPPGRFHGVLMLDVIEHIEKDVEFVRMVVHDLLEVDSWVLGERARLPGSVHVSRHGVTPLPALLTTRVPGRLELCRSGAGA